ncbi:uncharacterized protein Tco025E_07186, partial [Trypanosoma conorhini]
LQLGSNPIFGTCIVDLEEKPVKSGGDAESLLQDALKASPNAEEAVLLQLVVKQIKRPSSTTTDVSLSAMQLLFVKERGDYLAALHDKDAKLLPVPLFKDAVGGNSCTLVVAAVSGGDAVGETNILKNVLRLRKVKNSPSRSGNLTRFVEFTKEQERKCAATLESTKDAAEKARNTRILHKLKVVLADAQELMAKPEGTKPKVYTSSRTSQDKVTNGVKEKLEDTKPNGGSVLRDSEKKKEDETKDKTDDLTAKVVPLSRVVCEKGTAPAKKKAEDAATAKATDTATPSQPKALEGGDSAGSDSETWQTSARIAVTVEKKPTSNTIELSVKGKARRYGVDEHLQYTEGKPLESKLAKRMQIALGNGHNTALLAAEVIPGLAVEKQVTWNIVQSILEGVLKEKKDGVTNEFTLYMSVVKGKQVVCDLFSGSGPQPLVVAISPLYGVVLHETTPKVVKTAAEVEPALRSALTKASGLVKDDEYIVCTAVLKQILEGDVKVASLFAMSALDMRPYVGVMEKDPQYVRQLFGHAFIGSCSSVLLVSYAALDEKSTEALNAQGKMVLRNGKSRGGSVKTFVTNMEEAVAAAEAKVQKAATPKEKEPLEASLKQLQTRLENAKELLQNPKTTQPVAYAAPQEEGNAVDSTVRVVAVVTEKRESSGPWNVKADGDGFIVKAKGEEKRFPVDEVVQRASPVAGIRSTTVDSMVEQLLRGHNSALLTADDEGVTAGTDMLMHCARSLFAKLEEDAEVFVVLSAMKPDCSAAKDLQKDGAEYEPVSYASSPLFGPCITGAKMEPVTTAKDLLAKLKNGASVCEADKAVLVSLLIHKARRPEDVVLSSFLTVLAGTNVKLYSKALEVRPKERGILQYAFGGPCVTVVFLGLLAEASAAEAAVDFGELAKSVHGTSNSTVRDGGLRRFVMFSTKAQAQMQLRLRNASGTEKERLATTNANVELVLKDAEEMLRDPKGRPPKVYKQLH